ncbi:7-cyano-7-deazaguanine synthase [Nonomuraea basaltis]|uniref:7-cyano-7-deazaguanine synthase n=1 Tax=Nonomuraea basaltis TaxID=2495887 RepID=UPI0014869B44|nr:7-cyano-7-deazaguanine synthase [Nonomuraea basaltis]
MSRLTCTVHGVRNQLPLRTAEFDFGATPIWGLHGPLGSRDLSARGRDLVDLAGAIYRVESQIRRRATDPAVKWELVAPVRDLAFWTKDGGPLLASCLGFLNRARWTFDFSTRPDAVDFVRPEVDERPVDQITLFSGGMDSLCGAGSDKRPHTSIQLVSFYHGQASLQSKLASALGYHPPTQWRLTGQRGREGMNLIRSFMFLSLGAAVAESYGARHIVQYENGVLATAVPQSGNFIPTRHAHPETHRRMARLLDAVFEGSFTIDNPFLPKTKCEVGEALAATLGAGPAEHLLRETQTCWYLFQPKVGGLKKENGQPCGVCTPCIVRRTARPAEAAAGAWPDWPGYAFDLREPRYRDHPVVGTTFRAYLELVDIALTARSDAALIDDLAPEARALIDEVEGPSETLVAGLLRRFAGEFCDTFGITPSQPVVDEPTVDRGR